jgi:phosphoadenosine phosphosulfate reductase
MGSPSPADWAGVDLNNPRDVLRHAIKTYHPKLALACSFSLEDVALVHMAWSIDSSIRIFALDTGRLPPETYECAEELSEKYGLQVEWFFPPQAQVEHLVRSQGLYSFRTSLEARKACCGIRKVEGLKRALSGLEAWITGLRRDQSVTRDALEILETENGRVKINPLRSWTLEETNDYVKRNNIPYNRLFDQGYTSIGCAPCTRAVPQGGGERDGRWWWESAERKECGIHFVERDGETVLVRDSQVDPSSTP